MKPTLEQAFRLMEVFKKSRAKPDPGDIFTFKIKDKYFFGRVITADAVTNGVPWLPLIYTYNIYSNEKNKIPVLDKNNLLMPPFITNFQGWLRGVYETIEKRPLLPGDAFPKHCFMFVDVIVEEGKGPRKSYFDEYEVVQDGPFEPCGIYGVGSFALPAQAACEKFFPEIIAEPDKAEAEWGIKHFENDDALDFVGDLADGQTDVKSVLKNAIESSKDEPLESPDACIVLAAAELVAAANGKPSDDLPESAQEWLAKKGKTIQDLKALSQQVVKKVLKNSELNDPQMWRKPGTHVKWLDATKDLLDRLR